MLKRNIGRFSIDARLVEDHPEGVALCYARLRLVPVRVEHLWHMRRFEVVGISDQFREVADGEQIPDYDVSIAEIDGAFTVSVLEVR